MRKALIFFTLTGLFLVGCGSSGEGFNQLGVTSSKSGDHKKAIEYFDKAIFLNPNNADYFVNRGNSYYFLKQYDQAIENYTEAIRLSPDYFLPHMNLGSVYDDLGKPEKAIENYNHAIELEPDNPVPYRNRGVTLLRIGEFERALPDLNRAIALNPNYRLAYASRVVTLAALKRYDEAMRDYSRAIDLDPKGAPQTRLTSFLNQSDIAPDLKVINAISGMLQENEYGKTFLETEYVPLVEGQPYGWYMLLETNRSTIRFREELRLPGAPVTWGANESEQISNDRRLLVTEKEIQPNKEGVIGHSWRVAEGDPEGLYIMNVYIEDKLAGVFLFWIGERRSEVLEN